MASAGSGFFAAFNNAALPLLIPSSNVLLVNLLSNTRSIEGTVIRQLTGAWSDRGWTRPGRRRPFMLAALPISALFMAFWMVGLWGYRSIFLGLMGAAAASFILLRRVRAPEPAGVPGAPALTPIAAWIPLGA